MKERDVYATLMWACAASAAVFAIATVVMFVQVMYHGLTMMIPGFVLFTGVIASAGGVVYFGGRFRGNEKVFANPIEQEVLTYRQRQELRRKRGELVMERALVEIEHEKDNIVHRAIEAANDPTKPPHQTRFGDDGVDVVDRLQQLRNKNVWEDQ